MRRWLKIEVATPTKPEIIEAADRLGITQGDAFLAFFRLFAVLDEETVDGWLPRWKPFMIDDAAHQNDFCKALAEVGWLEIRTDGIMITNWARHNGQCAKRRALKAKQMAESRNRKQANRPVL